MIRYINIFRGRIIGGKCVYRIKVYCFNNEYKNNMMKHFKVCLTGFFSVFFLSVGVVSCWNDDDYQFYSSYPNALVTVKHTSDSVVYLQLNDTTTLFPVNMPRSPFGEKEVRALTHFKFVDKPSEGFSKAVHVNWIDSILTKQLAPWKAEANDSVYGNDPLEIIDDWVTIAEDGYLTLRFRTQTDGRGTRHALNLVNNGTAENPYVVELRHNAHGDICGYPADGLVAFSLDSLPDTQGKAVKLTLRWKAYRGVKTVEFDYCTHQATMLSKSGNARSIAEERATLLLE